MPLEEDPVRSMGDGIHNRMWSLLNRFGPFDSIARWWYVLLAGPLVGILLAFGTDVKFLRPPQAVAYVAAEGPLSSISEVFVTFVQEWRADITLVVVGLLISFFIIYLLEDIRGNIKPHSR